jgi:hypothetical protein
MADYSSTTDDFELISAVFSTQRGKGKTFSIAGNLIEFSIYEHLDTPYLTANFTIIDTNNMFETMDFQGGEFLKVSFQSLETQDKASLISKTFAIDKILKTTRPDERTEVVVLHGFEDIVIKSSVKNVNKHYKNTPDNIITSILSEYLSKDLSIAPEIGQSSMDVIVPNMHPIEAATWIKNRITSSDGLPFYLYSTLYSDALYLVDLGSILNKEPINSKLPFLYLQSAGHGIDNNYIPILAYKQENVEDVMSLIRKGYVGSEYSFLNTLKGENETVKFDVADDVFYNLAEKNYFKNQPKFVYAPDQKIDDIKTSSYSSKHITKIASSGAYTQDIYKSNSLDEEISLGGYRKRIVGDAIKNFMTKTPISITVPGRAFMRGDGDYTIGNIIKVMFLDVQHSKDEAGIDSKKSGYYTMYAARHSFSVFEPNRINSTLLCAKLSSFEADVSAEEFINAT